MPEGRVLFGLVAIAFGVAGLLAIAFGPAVKRMIRRWKDDVRRSTRREDQSEDQDR